MIARMKARDSKRIADLGQVQLALELYFDGNQMYPQTTPANYGGSATNCAQPGGANEAAIAQLANQNFLPKLPCPPAGGSATYVYKGVQSPTGTAAECTNASTTSCLSYALGVTLERTDNSVLANDADVAVGTFYGSYPDCSTNTAGTERCYDLKP
jgi:hypothetical protein